MTPESIVARYNDLQLYVGWTDDDAQRLAELGPLVDAHLEPIVHDFYQEIERHPETARVITGGSGQVLRLQATLKQWLKQLFSGRYDTAYILARWQVGLRHVEIGLHQVYTNTAIARLRGGLHRVCRTIATTHPLDVHTTVESINKLLDLDLAIIEDAYETRRLENEKLAERLRGERKFRNLVEAAACMIVILRDNRRLAYLSPFGERLTGWNPTELVGRDFLEIFTHVTTGAADPHFAAWTDAFTSLPAFDRELPIECRDGSQRWLVWNLRRLDDFDGFPAVLAVGHDVTEKRRADQKLVQAERLAAIGQTITGLAHESRNALQRINSCTEMLEFEVEGNAEALRLIQRSQQAQDDLTRLFDEVRNFAAPISLDRHPCSLTSIWREAWQVLQKERRGRDASLEEPHGTADVTLVVDRFRLTQVFRNLFENSLAACVDPVRIRVECRADEATKTIQFRVSDNGPGLTPQARREVFEPFFTTKPKGTGLGMAIAHRIAEAHGGA